MTPAGPHLGIADRDSRGEFQAPARDGIAARGREQNPDIAVGTKAHQGRLSSEPAEVLLHDLFRPP
jgi:hypothetical protein